MGSTNYSNTFVQVAADCPVAVAEEPPASPTGQTIAALQYQLISAHPYEFTSDDLLFEVHAIRVGLTPEEWRSARAAFFARSQACLRSSPLGKRYGWGIHHDTESRLAIVRFDSDLYGLLLPTRPSHSSRQCAPSECRRD